jgi:hypothetical protein
MNLGYFQVGIDGRVDPHQLPRPRQILDALSQVSVAHCD